MIDFKRIAYLFLLAMLIGLVLVHVRSSHFRTVYETTRLMEQQRQEQRRMWIRQVELSHAISSPSQIRSEVERLGLRVRPPGALPSQVERVAKKAEPSSTEVRR